MIYDKNWLIYLVRFIMFISALLAVSLILLMPPDLREPITKIKIIKESPEKASINESQVRVPNQDPAMEILLGPMFTTEPVLNPHNFKFLISEDGICLGRRSDVFVINVVHTAPLNYKRRMLIREAWGNRNLYSVIKMVTVFALGTTLDDRAQTAIELESSQFHDIIQEDFLDSYKNLTYKSIMWLKWISIYCPNAQYVVKTDDDIFVNAFNLVLHLQQLYRHSIAHTRTFLCLVWNGMLVMRDDKSKWYVSKEDFPKDEYPRYCSGSAYILTQDIIYPLYQASFHRKFFWVDDVYTTGILPEGLNISYHSLQSLYVITSSTMEDNLVNGYALFGHVGSLRSRQNIWSKVLAMRGIK